MKQIPIIRVKVPAARRMEVDNDLVERLAESMKEIGLLQPIGILLNSTLIYGLHRLEAAKLLGWVEIDAVTKKFSELNRELAEVDENLVCKQLTELEQGKQLDKRRQLYEAKYPSTKQKTGAGLASKRWKESDKKQEVNASELNSPAKRGQPKTKKAKPKTFTQDTADKTGVSQRTIQQKVQIARKINPATEKIIKDTEVANRKSDLLNLARIADPESQAQAAEAMVETLKRKVVIATRKRRRNKLCAACMHCKRQPLPAGAKDQERLIRCSEGHFELAEENQNPMAWNPHDNICPDFDGDLAEARGLVKTALASGEKQQHINLAAVLPPILLAAIHRHVKGGYMVYLPKAGREAKQFQRQLKVIEAFELTHSVNATAKTVNMSRQSVRSLLDEARISHGKNVEREWREIRKARR